MRYLLLFLFLLPTLLAFEMDPVEFQVVNGTGIGYMAGTRYYDANPATIAVTWYLNGNLTQNNSYGATNASQIVDLIQPTYAVGDTLSVFFTAFQATNTTSVQATLPACNDGLDNDGDGTIDLADAGCLSVIDTNEGGEVVCATGGGNYLPQQSTIQMPTTPQNQTFLQAGIEGIKDLFTREIPCNDKDDNNNGLIDENCPYKNLTITTDTGAKSLVLYIPPGSVRDDRGVKVTNNGEEEITATLSCSASSACDYLFIEPSVLRPLPSVDLPEDAKLTFRIPLLEEEGNVYRMVVNAEDSLTGKKDGILIELHIGGRIALLESILGRPLRCVNMGEEGKKQFCITPLNSILFMIGIAILFLLGRYWWQRRRHNNTYIPPPLQ